MSEDLQNERHKHTRELFARLEDQVAKQERRIERMETMRKIERVAWILIGVWLASNPTVVPLLRSLAP